MLYEAQAEFFLAKIILSVIITLLMISFFTEFRYPKRWAVLCFGVYMGYVFSISWFLMEGIGYVYFLRVMPIVVFLPASLLFYFLAQDSISKVIFNGLTQVNIFIVLWISGKIMSATARNKPIAEIIVFVVLFSGTAAMEYIFLRRTYKAISHRQEYNWPMMSYIAEAFFAVLWINVFFLANDEKVKNNVWTFLSIYAIVALMVIVYAVFFLSLIKNQSLLEKSMKYNVMIAQLSAQKQYYEMILDKRRELYRMRKQVAAASELLWQGNFSKVADELMDIAERAVPEDVRKYCANIRLNAAIAYHATKCIENNIRFSCDMQLGDSKLPEEELCLILNHGLENALLDSAVLPMEQRFIKLQSKIVQGQLLIRIKNRTNASVLSFEGLPHSTKQNEGHNHGLYTIEAAAKRANGEMMCYIEGDSFVLDVRVLAGPIIN